jgi:glyoxylase-like metal-dependent hydrolase (beta-lactamase superfamily II)
LIPLTIVGLAVVSAGAWAQTAPTGPDVKPFTPFKIIANIHYVGDANEAVYLITTPAGHILLDTGYAETVPVIRAGVEQLGFDLRDIRIMISGHAHADHVAGHWLMQELTGARVLASQPDAIVIESGGASGDPNIVEDFQKTFQTLYALPCDVFLGPHGRFYDLEGKFARMQAGAVENPFIDPAGCRQFIEQGESAFLQQLEEERRTRQ